jgi:Uma2 family endonuclease
MTLLDQPTLARKSGLGPPGTLPPAARAHGSPDPEVRFTVDQYHAMLDAGILQEGDPIELLEGQLVWKDRSATGEDPMTVGDAHAWVLDAIQELDPRFRKLGCYVRIQQPVTFSPSSEPEPDAAIVRGTRDDYRGRHPGPKDILCLIEVADSSLTRDRSLKYRIYAKAGVPLYVIINLQERVAEVYTMPRRERYADPQLLKPRAKLTLPTAKKPLVVKVGNLLP